jgi:hypothetical protein
MPGNQQGVSLSGALSAQPNVLEDLDPLILSGDISELSKVLVRYWENSNVISCRTVATVLQNEDQEFSLQYIRCVLALYLAAGWDINVDPVKSATASLILRNIDALNSVVGIYPKFFQQILAIVMEVIFSQDAQYSLPYRTRFLELCFDAKVEVPSERMRPTIDERIISGDTGILSFIRTYDWEYFHQVSSKIVADVLEDNERELEYRLGVLAAYLVAERAINVDPVKSAVEKFVLLGDVDTLNAMVGMQPERFKEIFATVMKTILNQEAGYTLPYRKCFLIYCLNTEMEVPSERMRPTIDERIISGDTGILSFIRAYDWEYFHQVPAKIVADVLEDNERELEYRLGVLAAYLVAERAINVDPVKSAVEKFVLLGDVDTLNAMVGTQPERFKEIFTTVMKAILNQEAGYTLPYRKCFLKLCLASGVQMTTTVIWKTLVEIIVASTSVSSSNVTHINRPYFPFFNVNFWRPKVGQGADMGDAQGLGEESSTSFSHQ